MVNDSIIKTVSEIYEKSFRGKYLVVRSPGRINIIGEHTDYNEGFVLPAAIDKATYIAIGPRNDREIKLIAHDLNKTFEGNTGEITKTSEGWPNYILGVIAQFQKADIDVVGFNVVISSDVPFGAGLSSSAALECAVVYGLNAIMNAGLDKITMVKMAQKAEHEYAGVMCGIMDQFASIMGKIEHLIQLDCRSMEYNYIPISLAGYDIVLLNTNVTHSLASSEYNTRRNECHQALSWIKEHLPHINSLRDVDETMLDKYVKPKDDLINQRARYVVQEISRLKGACEDLQNGKLLDLGKKMKSTHDGLSKMYGVSCRELDYLVDFVASNEAVIGSRMMGGGFGGCTINIIKKSETSSIIAKVKKAYEKDMKLPLTSYITSVEDGTGIVKPLF
jgi:galactokinase